MARNSASRIWRHDRSAGSSRRMLAARSGMGDIVSAPPRELMHSSRARRDQRASLPRAPETHDTAVVTSSIRAVLFDFAGTLFSPQPASTWVASAARETGLDLSPDEIDRLAPRCLRAGLPGAPSPSAVPDDLAAAYAERDLSSTAHRTAYTGLLDGAGEGRPGLAEAIYARILGP